MKEIDYKISILEDYLLQKNSLKWITKNVLTTKDIYDHRNSIKQLESNPKVVDYIASIILDQIKSNKRFRKFDCIKVLKILKFGVSDYNMLSQNTVTKIFDIYKNIIFLTNQDLLWNMSSCLKDLPLSEESIDWLLENFNKSKHITNRLLLYPSYNLKIWNWAKDIYLKNELPTRNYELIALLIKDDLPSFIKKESSNEILWAIYKSRISLDKKNKLLIKYSDLNSIETVISISERFETSEIVKGLLNKLKAS